MIKGYGPGPRTGGLLAAMGLWALVAVGYAWVERDAVLGWISESVERPTPSERLVASFDPPDCRLCPSPSASAPDRLLAVPLDLLNAVTGTR